LMILRLICNGFYPGWLYSRFESMKCPSGGGFGKFSWGVVAD
jgi:hypothetical protein